MSDRIERDKELRERSLALSGEGTEYFAAYKRRVIQRIVERAVGSDILK